MITMLRHITLFSWIMWIAISSFGGLLMAGGMGAVIKHDPQGYPVLLSGLCFLLLGPGCAIVDVYFGGKDDEREGVPFKLY